MAQKSGSETLGGAGDKSKMTLFKDDRAEDIGAIIVAALVIAYVMVATSGKAPGQPPPAPATQTTAPAPAAPAPK